MRGGFGAVTIRAVDEFARLGAQDPGFVADLRAAVRVWKTAPLLPILAVVVNLGYVAGPGAAREVLGFVFMVALLGWVGIERVWYLRAFREGGLRLGDLPELWRAYAGRFFRLGCFVMLPCFALVLVMLVTHANLTVFTTSGAVVGVLLDVLLTFVTPALTFTTASAREAIKIGVRMIRETWPACALYVVVPPLALQVVSARYTHEAIARAVLLTAATLIALAFKGGTARFYLRRHETGDLGFLRPESTTGAQPPRPDVP